MRQLLIDAGNSRLKWALLRDVRAGTGVGAGAGRGAGRTSMGCVHSVDWHGRNLTRVASAIMSHRYTRAMVCSVAGSGVERALRRAARQVKQPAPQFIRSTRQSRGVRNGYAETWRLGADRWVAMLGARALYPRRALCVVNIGTALTVDVIDAKGQHRGGLLAPGPTLMIETLLARTAGIRRRAGGRARPGSAMRDTVSRGSVSRGQRVLGRSTQEGLVAGSTLACAALIERAARAARLELGTKPTVILAGGATAQVTPLLQVAHRRVDDLVLRGLALLATHE